MIDLSTAPIPAAEVRFYSDASANEKLGFGCVVKNSWTWGCWEKDFIEQKRPSIEYLELFALCVRLFTWEKELSNLRMIVQ